jgi:hypothetical protein
MSDKVDSGEQSNLDSLESTRMTEEVFNHIYRRSLLRSPKIPPELYLEDLIRVSEKYITVISTIQKCFKWK